MAFPCGCGLYVPHYILLSAFCNPSRHSKYYFAKVVVTRCQIRSYDGAASPARPNPLPCNDLGGASLALALAHRNPQCGVLAFPHPADVGLTTTMPLAHDLAVPDVADEPASIPSPHRCGHAGVYG